MHIQGGLVYTASTAPAREVVRGVESRIMSGGECGAEDPVRFFERPENFRVLASVNEGHLPVSLRTLSWFLSSGSLDAVDSGIRADYEERLRTLSRRRFDPFRRCDRVSVSVGDETVVTTVGQMNFFRWMIESGLWAYVIENKIRIADESQRSSSDAGGAAAPETHASRRASVAPGFSQVSGKRVVIFD